MRISAENQPELEPLPATDLSRTPWPPQTLPELVVYDNNGQPESVAYHLLPTLLLNELQKAHQQIARQSAKLQQARQLIQAQGEQLAALKTATAETLAMQNRLSNLERLTAKLLAARNAEQAVTDRTSQVAMVR